MDSVGIDTLFYIASSLLAALFFLARIFWNRVFAAHDELKERILLLERSAVTHEDLQRLEGKLDYMTQRLDRYLERTCK